LYPGKITKDFLEGRRGRYVPPIRLYFLISFIFFLGLGSMVDKALSENSNFLTDNIITTEKTNEVKTGAKKNLKNDLKEAEDELNQLKADNDTTGLEETEQKVKEAKLALELYDKVDNKTQAVQKKANKWIDFTDVSVEEILDEMNIQRSDTLRALVDNLPEEKQRQRLIEVQKQIIGDTINTEAIPEINKAMREYFTEVIGKKQHLSYSLNLHALKNNTAIKINYDQDTVITIHGSDGSLKNTTYMKKVLKMSDSELDSLIEKNGDGAINFSGFKSLNRGFFKNLTYYELAFSEDAEKAISEIAHLSIGTFSLMMFILMPIVAFLLKIIFSKRTHSVVSYPFRLFRYLWDWVLYLIRFRKIRKYHSVPHLVVGHTRYYYEHLIFSIHIHSVFFLMLIIFVGGGVALGFWKQALILTMSGFFLYFIISLRVVYRQGLLKTILKSIILFFMYVLSFVSILSLTGAFKFALS
jgi:hypothetical protein